MPRSRPRPQPQPHHTDHLQQHDWLRQLAQLPASDYIALVDTIRNLDKTQLRTLDRNRPRETQ